MSIDVTMPKLTDSMEEGRIVEWRIAVGSRVREGDVLAEIETDKAVMELESFWEGAVMELVRSDGDVVGVGEVIARLTSVGEVAADVSPPAAEPAALPVETPAPEETEVLPAEPLAPRPPPTPPSPPRPSTGAPKLPQKDAADRSRRPSARAVGDLPIPGGHPLSERGGVASPRPAPPPRPTAAPSIEDGGGGVRAAPRARRRALALGVDLAEVRPSGGDGQVTVEDVEAAAKDTSVATAGPPTGMAADRADEELPPLQFPPEEAEEEPVSFYQKAAIRRVVASKHVIPHFYVTKAVRADRLLARQGTEKQATGATLTHCIMRACAKALEAFPDANRSYDRGRWIRWRVVHLGLAVQTEAGLVVAVLHDVQQRSLGWIAEHTRALVDRARAGKLTGPERTNPTFTISNLGAYDVESFAAIINPPSAMTLAVGSVVDTPVVEGKQIVAGRVMHLTLSCDHRVVDGVLAARFLGEVKRLLEEPGEL